VIRRLFLVPALTLLLVVAGCGDDEVTVSPGAGSDQTIPDDTQPDDTPPGDDSDDAGDEFPTQQAIDEARSVLGMDEADLPDDVRIARRGDEQFALTEDYRLGRRTVELDEDEPGSGYRVMSVTVELPDGPETYVLEPS
jgi:hypothetical protein